MLTAADGMTLSQYIGLVAEHPLDPQMHGQLAEMYAANTNWFAAIAEYRTAIALGNVEPQVWLSLAKAYIAIGMAELAIPICQRLDTAAEGRARQEITNILAKARTATPWPLSYLDHNRYYRIKTLADHLSHLFGEGGFSVLDVGGGDGALALFVPDAAYVLAEPAINGISGTNLPFAQGYFDAILACHVLEHVSLTERSHFLEQLCSKARKCVLLLNPFLEPNAHVRERIQLVFELTGAQWAKEHLECGLPHLDQVRQFAADHSYGCRVWPCGSLTASLALEFVRHYATLAGRERELERINHLYNTRYFEQLTAPQLPAAYLVEIDVN